MLYSYIKLNYKIEKAFQIKTEAKPFSWRQFYFLTKICSMRSWNLGAFYAKDEWKMLDFPIEWKFEVTICSSKLRIHGKAHLLLDVTASELGLPCLESLG